MCTLSLFPGRGHLILTMNRDERRDRGEGPELAGGYSPETGIHYCHPVDGQRGGTWFGFNSAGMAAALINRYQDRVTLRADPTPSRGQIIPRLLPKKNAAQVRVELQRLDWPQFAPCDLLLIWHDKLERWSWNGERLTPSMHPIPQAYFFTSTSLDPQAVTAYRKQIFYWFTATHRFPLEAGTVLRDLHLRRCIDDPSMGIFMSRRERHTKSLCQLAIGRGSMDFLYLDERRLSELNPAAPLQSVVRRVVRMTGEVSQPTRLRYAPGTQTDSAHLRLGKG